MGRLFVAALASVLVFSLVGSNQASIVFSIVASDGDVIGGKSLTNVHSPVMSNSGDVVFEGIFGPTNTRGVFTPNSLVATAGTLIDGHVVGSTNPPNISSTGVIAFNSSGGLFTDSEFIASGASTSVPGINASGEIIWRSFFSGGGSGLLTQNRLVVETGDVIQGKTLTDLTPHPLIDNSGNAYFFSNFDGGFGYFSETELIVAKDDEVSGKTLTNFGGAFVNGSGDFVFTGIFDDGGSDRYGIFSATQALFVDPVTLGGVTYDLFAQPSLNNLGRMAHVGNDRGLFLDDSLLITEGDMLGGKTIRRIQNPSLNDHGDIAFEARFTDGSFSIVVATGAIPEPSAIAIWSVLGLVGAGVRRRRNRAA